MLGFLAKYLVQNSQGSEGILAVLDSLSQQGLPKAGPKHKTEPRIARDCELVTVAIAARLFGSAPVFRGPRRRKSHVARVFWPHVKPEDYLALRISVPPSLPERILLDTNAVRKIIHGDRDSLDIHRLLGCKGGHPVSLPFPTSLELSVALAQGRPAFEEWAAKVGMLDEVLDPEHPVVPGIPTEFAPVPPDSHCRAGWHLIRHAASVDDLKAGRDFIDETGNRDTMLFDPDAERTLEEFRKRYLERQAGFATYDGPTEIEDIVAALKLRGELVTGRSLEGADLELRCSVVRALEITKAGTAPGSHRLNDAVDGALLGFVETGILCTSDQKLKALVDRSTSFDAWRVMLPAQLLEWLEACTVPFGPDAPCGSGGTLNPAFL
jgi:hypothetical protein